VARELGESSTFPWGSVKAMGEDGVLGVPVPHDLESMELYYQSYTLVEELAKHDASHAITVTAHTTLGTSPVISFGPRSSRSGGCRCWPAERGREGLG
jgi:butyryl-CoA dehydrogenase